MSEIEQQRAEVGETDDEAAERLSAGPAGKLIALNAIAWARSDNEEMRLDITHLLYAIDRGYFGDDNCIKDSAFIDCLRKWTKPGFDPVAKATGQ